MSIKATATRAEKNLHKRIAQTKSFTGKSKLDPFHIDAKDYDALEATGKLHSFGVELIRI